MKTRLCSYIGFALAVSLWVAPGRAAAQRGIDAELFHPALDSFGIFTVDRAQTSHQWDFGFKFYINYASNPLSLGMFGNGNYSQKVLIDRQVALNFGAHLGLTNWLELAIDLPVSSQSYTADYGSQGGREMNPPVRTGFYQNGPYTNIPPPDAAPLDSRLALKARVFRQGPFGVALAGILTVPFGDDSAFLGDANFTFRPELIVDFTKGPFTAALNGGFIFRERTRVLDPHDLFSAITPAHVLLEVGDEISWSAGAAYHFIHWAGVAAEIYGYEPIGNSKDAPNDRTVDVLGGLQFFPGRDVAVGVGAGADIIAGARRHDAFRIFGGITWAPAEGKGGITAGALDSDGDGIPDSQDLCPNEPEDKDGFDDEDGCPDPDNDQDGIPDKDDKCPNEPEDRDGFQDEDGCPELDNDGDGIPDAQDKCPNEPEDKDGFQDDDGCPDLDNDGDGIPDAVDKCPNEPETFNGVDDQDGCPDTGGKVLIAGGKIELPENILFETGKAVIAGRSEALLDRIADKIKSNPQVKRIRIEGHTDNVGTVKKNTELSQARAESVRTFLIKKGVEADRLQAVGYGDSRPLDKRNTGEARAKNRRVEFIIVEQ